MHKSTTEMVKHLLKELGVDGFIAAILEQQKQTAKDAANLRLKSKLTLALLDYQEEMR